MREDVMAIGVFLMPANNMPIKPTVTKMTAWIDSCLRGAWDKIKKAKTLFMDKSFLREAVQTTPGSMAFPAGVTSWNSPLCPFYASTSPKPHKIKHNFSNCGNCGNSH